MLNPVPTSEIIEALIHIRDLFRGIRPSNERQLRALERREAATKDLLSNLPRTNEHPTLRTLLEIAEIYLLTLGGAHRLFGYSLQDIREFDLDLNRGRTHIFESYPFDRDLLVDLPARRFRRRCTLRGSCSRVADRYSATGAGGRGVGKTRHVFGRGQLNHHLAGEGYNLREIRCDLFSVEADHRGIVSSSTLKLILDNFPVVG